jgi:ribonucleoside-triphosphate reductase
MGEGIASEKGYAFALKVMDHIRGRMEEIQQETGDIFNLEATPAEGTGYRLAMMDKKDFPEAVFANGDSEEPFYTNSTHLPVNYSDDVFEVLQLQDELQTKYTGGTVLHLFLGEEVSDINAVKSFVKKVASNFRLPYFTLSPTFSVCPTHGYIKGEVATCETCGDDTEIYARVVGYLRPVQQWNDGKRCEFSMRKTFKLA